MKKLLGIVVLGLLLSGNAFARISIFSESSSNTGGWLAALIVCGPFFAYVWYDSYREKKYWLEEIPKSKTKSKQKKRKRKKK